MHVVVVERGGNLIYIQSFCPKMDSNRLAISLSCSLMSKNSATPPELLLSYSHPVVHVFKTKSTFRLFATDLLANRWLK